MQRAVAICLLKLHKNQNIILQRERNVYRVHCNVLTHTRKGRRGLTDWWQCGLTLVGCTIGAERFLCYWVEFGMCDPQTARKKIVLITHVLIFPRYIFTKKFILHLFQSKQQNEAFNSGKYMCNRLIFGEETHVRRLHETHFIYYSRLSLLWRLCLEVLRVL